MKFWVIWQMQTENWTYWRKIPTRIYPILTAWGAKISICNVSLLAHWLFVQSYTDRNKPSDQQRYSGNMFYSNISYWNNHSEDLDSCRNQRSQQIKYLQIENEKLRMDLNNETTHGKKLERTVEDLNNRLLDAQNQLRITESKMASR